jgi:hypothetical protein
MGSAAALRSAGGLAGEDHGVDDRTVGTGDGEQRDRG